MKKNPASVFIAVSALLSPFASAVDGTWTQVASGNDWNVPGNWAGNTIADGLDGTATFSQDLAAGNFTVNLGADRTIGNISFSDTDTATAGSWIIAGNTLTLDATTPAFSPTITVNALGTGATATISSIIAGNDGLTKAGAGTLVLSGANTYTGGTNITAGVLRIGNAAGLGSTTAAATVSSGATFDVGGQNSALNVLTISGTGTSGQGAIYNSSGSEGSVGNIILAGNASIGSAGAKLNLRGTVSGANTLTIATGGLVDLRVDAFQPGVTGVIVNGGLVAEANQTSNVAYTVNANGTIAGYGARSISGAITLNGGTLVANDGSNGNNATTFSGPITLLANSTIGSSTKGFGSSSPGGANININGAISGNFGLTFGGFKTTTLAVANSYTGGTTINGGVVKLGNAASLGSTTAAATVNSGATLDVNGQNNARNVVTISGTGSANQGAIYNSGGNEGSVGNVTLAGDATVGSNGQKLNLYGTLSGAFTLTTTAGSAVVLRTDGIQSNVTGVTVNGAVMAEASQGSNGKFTVNSTGGVGAYVNNGNISIAGPITLNGGALFANSGVNANTLTVSGPITLLANSTIGTTAFGFAGGTGGAGNIAVTNGISGNFGLTFGGNKTTTLSGTNSYTGTTTISGGTLLVNGNNTAATGALSSLANTTVGGTGIIGATTATVNGTLQGGAGAVGQSLTMLGAVTFADNSTVLLTLGAGGTHSSIAFNGTEAFDNNQAFTFLDAGVIAGTTFQDILTGVTLDPGTTASWIINNPGWTGTFTWDGANIDLLVTAVPEPGVALLGGLGVLALLRRRRS